MSAPINGDFTCTVLLEVRDRAEAIFNDDVRAPEYVAEVTSALAVIDNQTANFAPLQDPEKDRYIKVYWVDDCDDEDPTECTTECEAGGDTIGSACETYQLDTCFEKSFSITEKQFRLNTLSREEVVAKMLLKKLKLMDEYWAKKVIAFLDLNSGTNNYVPTGYTQVGTNTFVPAPAWNPDLMGYLTMALRKNKLRAGVLLSGDNLYQHFWKTEMEAGNVNNAGDSKKLNSLGKPYFDLFWLDSIIGAKSTFIFNGNSIAFVTKNYYPDAGVDINANNVRQTRYTIPSPNLPGVKYDVRYSVDCIDGDDGLGDLKHNWTITSYGGIFLNPLSCTPDRTGILEFRCGDGS